MNHIELWKLGTDLLLLMSLIYFCLRFTRRDAVDTSSERLVELEATLRGLIKEADASSQTLTTQLTKRQEALEKLLYEIETAEHRINKSVTLAEECKASLSTDVRRAQDVISHIQERVSFVPPLDRREPATSKPFQEIIPAGIKNEPRQGGKVGDQAPSYTLGSQTAPEPPSFDMPPYESQGGEKHSRRSQTSLAARVEREVDNLAADSAQADSIMAGVFEAADRAMRAGNEVQKGTVALGGQKSAQLSAKDHKEQDSVPPFDSSRHDPRLGVLGGIRRQVQVL